MDSLLKDKNTEDIGKMFDDIAPGYDCLNHFLSFNIDKYWRAKLIRLLQKENPAHILDVATGTADLALATAKRLPHTHITGIDIAEKMLEKGRKKIIKNNAAKHIELRKAAAENLPFADNTFDSVMVAFGVRNFQHLNTGLREMLRVAKPGKKIFILEFSKPRGLFKFIYTMYFRLFLPLAGRLISGNKKAYQYLHDSVVAFPEGNGFLDIMKQNAYCHTCLRRLSGGIATIYTGEKEKII